MAIAAARFAAVPVSARTPGFVSNAPLQRAFKAGGLTAGQLGLLVGRTRRTNYGRNIGGDHTAVLRDLGLAIQYNGGGRISGRRRRINEAKALRYAKALGVDPVDLGL
jgi:hypothetical protein